MTAERRGRAVPKGRIERTARLAGLGAGIAGGALARVLGDMAKGERPDLARAAFSPANARRFAGELSRLRGAALKLGQLVSMDAGALVPAEFAGAADALRAGADPMPPAQLRRVLDRRWGAGWRSRFDRFDPHPFAAASIGQVHRAVTIDGRALAIKIQYPGVKASIDSDLAGVATLARLSGALPGGFDLDPYLEEARAALHDESDYEREAQSVSRFAAALGPDPDFVVPGVDERFSGPETLALDLLPGAGIETAAEQDGAERERVFLALADLTLRELFDFRLMQTDPNYANFLYAGPDAPIGLIDFGAVRDLPSDLSDAYRALLRSGLAADRAGLETALDTLGFLPEDAAPRHREAALALAEHGFSAVRAGAFDFSDTGFLEDLRDAGFTLQRDGFTPAPRPQTLFVNRKIAGLYLLGAKLRVRAAMRERLKAWV
ncbi:MAG: ABC1 kinase family protein [Oceanicaulis sp.]